jgi:hypothetical protein
MSWDDHNRRRAAIAAVLDFAARHPSAGLPFEVLPQAQAVFRDRRELVLALQYDWMQALWARIELLALTDGSRRPLVDAADLAGAAWADCARQHPVLRRLLDCYRDELGPALLREREILRRA